MPKRTQKPVSEKPLGFVYFVGAMLARRVKIGFSQFNPDERFNALNTASPEDLARLGLMRGDLKLERSLHVRFASHRVKLEWFHLAPEIEAFISAEAAPWEEVLRQEKERLEAHKREYQQVYEQERVRIQRVSRQPGDPGSLDDARMRALAEEVYLYRRKLGASFRRDA